MSQKEFGDALGVSRQTVNNWLSMDTLPNKNIIDYMHERGVNLIWIMTGDGSPYNETVKGKQLAASNAYDTEPEGNVSEVRETTVTYIPNINNMTINEIREYYKNVKKILPELERIVGDGEHGMEELW